MRLHFRLHRLLHRVTGLCVALPLMLFVCTGVPLQFTVALQLGTQGVPFAWVHEAYGITPPESVLTTGDWVQIDDTLMTHGQETTSSGRLLGVHRFGELSVVATSKEMLLVPVEDGVPIERTEFAFTVNRFGLSDNLDLLIDTAGGVQVSTDLGASWRAEIPQSAQWLSVSSRPPSVDEARRYASRQLSWERWLQDLHSGRFFGVIGVWLMSFAGVAFMLLSVTGLYMWYSTRRRAS